MAWVENIRNLSNGYPKVTRNQGDRFKYLVPFPLWLTSTTKAHWTTDVIVLDPSCSWQPATTTEPVNLSRNVTLPESNFGISLRNDSLGMPLLSFNVFTCLLYFSIKQWQYYAAFNFHALQQKCYGILSSCGRFRTFCHRST